jgi:hypothetical protein
MADIIKFKRKPTPPKKKVLVLVDNIDLAFVLFAVNVFGMEEGYGLIGPLDLPSFKIDFVLDCLEEAKTSNLLTADGKAIISRLIANNG